MGKCDLKFWPFKEIQVDPMQIIAHIWKQVIVSFLGPVFRPFMETDQHSFQIRLGHIGVRDIFLTK